MKNKTLFTYFYLFSFSEETRNKPFITAFFFLIYLVGVLINSSIITVICLEVQLHKPMYLFICNLSIVDIFYTSVTVPKLLHMLLSGNHIISSAQCYTQMYCLVTVAVAEDILLFVMAYDRYVAICDPLHYNHVLCRRNCILITIGFWAAAFLNSFIFLLSALYMSSCHSNVIHQFFCDPKSLTKTICMGRDIFVLLINLMEVFLFAFVPLMCTFISYLKIFSIILKMKSRDSRSKAFSTCSSHLTVISIYYVSCLAEYLIPSLSEIVDVVFSVIYVTITPVINPIIYSLQNNNVKAALLRFIREIINFKDFILYNK